MSAHASDEAMAALQCSGLITALVVHRNEARLRVQTRTSFRRTGSMLRLGRLLLRMYAPAESM
jgi:hypothetical protein